MNELQKLAKFLSELSNDKLPKEVIRAATNCIVDIVGVSLGAAQDRQIQNALREMLVFYDGKGVSTLWGQGRKATPQIAMFFNGMMAHTLELDDVHAASKTHIGTVVVPAAWAMAEALGSSGEQLLTAVICGYETASRVGMALGASAHRNRGWHATATAGVFGAAAVCGSLLGLNAEQMAWALGMAGTQAFGLWAFLQDGASCKVLHPARAAVNGCDAALLAHAGMSGPPSLLPAQDGGLLEAMSDGHDVSFICTGLGEYWEILHLDNKPYPCCRSTHCAIDAMFALRSGGLHAEQVESVEIKTYLVGKKQCGSSTGSLDPHTATEAKFSLPYMAACALMDGKIYDEQFLPQRIDNPQTRALAKRISVVADDEFTARYPAHWGCSVRVTCRDGSTHQVEIQDPAGSVYCPLTQEQLHDKVAILMVGVLGTRTEKMIDTLMRVDMLERLSDIGL
jgi:2-methylcitrate dehydratase PrpD